MKTKHKWFDKLSKSDKFEVFNSNGYTLRLFSSKDIIEKTYNNLYEKKIVVGIVKENNLVFSVTNNKEIEGIIFDEIFSNN